MNVTLSEDIRSLVQNSLHTLTDHGGFRRVDAAFGHELAAVPHLSLVELVVSTRLVRRYQRQLNMQEGVLPDEATILTWAIENDEIISEEEITLTQEFAERRDSSPVPSTEQSQSPANAKNQAGKKEQSTIEQVSVQDDRIVVEFPFDRAKVNAIRPLKEIIEDWAFNHYQRQEWSFPLDTASTVYDVLRGFPNFTYSVDAVHAIKRAFRKETLEHQAGGLMEHWHELSQYAALEAAQPFLDGAPTANGQHLFRHQREAIQRMIEAERFILAHDMGLGKTKSSLIAAQAYHLTIWVIVPAGAIIN
jgi:hypothetical protein